MKEHPYAVRIEKKLREAFSPLELAIIDDSAKHHGHAGAHPSGETHFTVRIKAAAFNNLSRLERQRRVYALLADEMKERVHALSLELAGTDG